MSLLLLKLVLSPTVMMVATLAGRRFGPAAGGWLAGLPLTAGPVALIVTVQHGPRFAAGVAGGFLAGVAAQAAFALGYTWLCRPGRGWRRPLCAGTAAFATTGAVLAAGRPPALGLGACAVAALALALRLAPRDGSAAGLRRAASSAAGSAATGPLPGAALPLVAGSRSAAGTLPATSGPVGAGSGSAAAPPARDLPLRALLAGTVMLGVTSIASAVGPTLSGLVATFPLMSTLMAVFAHRRDGPHAAAAVYRGLLVGLFSFTGFSVALVLLLPHTPAPVAFELALLVTLTIQATSFHVARQGRTIAAWTRSSSAARSPDRSTFPR